MLSSLTNSAVFPQSNRVVFAATDDLRAVVVEGYPGHGTPVPTHGATRVNVIIPDISALVDRAQVNRAMPSSPW